MRKLLCAIFGHRRWEEALDERYLQCDRCDKLKKNPQYKLPVPQKPQPPDGMQACPNPACNGFVFNPPWQMAGPDKDTYHVYTYINKCSGCGCRYGIELRGSLGSPWLAGPHEEIILRKGNLCYSWTELEHKVC